MSAMGQKQWEGVFFGVGKNVFRKMFDLIFFGQFFFRHIFFEFFFDKKNRSTFFGSPISIPNFPKIPKIIQGSTTIYNVIYGGLALKIPKNIIYAERYIWRLDFSIFETVLGLDRDFSPLRGENFLQILVHVLVVFRSKHVRFYNFVV